MTPERPNHERGTRPDLAPELIELLQDDPELLAIADAVRATQSAGIRAAGRRPSFTRRRVTAVVLVAAAIAVALGVMQLGGGRRLSLVDNAAAAIGAAPVVHASFDEGTGSDSVVDLATLRATGHTERVEIWVPSDQSHVVARVRAQGSSITISERAAAAARGSAAAHAAELLTAYRAAAARQHLEVVSSSARLVSFALPRGGVATAKLNRDYLPVRVEPRNGSALTLSAVSVEEKAPSSIAPATGSIVDERQVAAVYAINSLPHLHDAGSSVAGLPLRSALVQRLVAIHGMHSSFASGVAFEYGSISGRFIDIRAAASPEPAYMYEGGLTIAYHALPQPGAIAVHATTSPATGAIWVGQMKSDGVYYTLRASSRALLLAGARRLGIGSR